MTIYPLPSLEDNYIWLIQDNDSSDVWVVDPGDAKPVQTHCAKHNLTIKGIIVTHHHWDHTNGILALKCQFTCPIYGPEHLHPKLVSHPVKEGDTVRIFDLDLTVWETPGHTLDHICFVSQDADHPLIFCGDTVFRGGCGRLMEGTPEQMHSSLSRIGTLAPETLMYGTHEYSLANYKFAKSLEPTNQRLIDSEASCQELRGFVAPTLPTTLELELATNPFFRSSVPTVVDAAAHQLNQTPDYTPAGAFAQIRRAKDLF
ncbi:hydroxyacylglutathione hydrolase [Marinomonas mediterranea]|uniref:hydroxyacylglutathione hydrolase n=1 Tax=Marinomonas mediterranea TaxID=119864 RepID=UPI00234B5B7E|nr:hydroxyacylglutathione hydrolase [Marinomonas mediterranea]WCN14074.1 hydroxyacylglutathione hydrolase [Marinomonas mediterranea]